MDSVFTIVWKTTDILEREPKLTQVQAELVLMYIKDNYDANNGVTWDDIDNAIELYRGDE